MAKDKKTKTKETQKLKSKFEEGSGLTGKARRKALSKVYEKNRKLKLKQPDRGSKYDHLPEVRAVRHNPQKRKEVLLKLYRSSKKQALEDEKKARERAGPMLQEPQVLPVSPLPVSPLPPQVLPLPGSLPPVSPLPALPLPADQKGPEMVCACADTGVSSEVSPSTVSLNDYLELKKKLRGLQEDKLRLERELVLQQKRLSWHENVRDWISSGLRRALRREQSMILPDWIVMEGLRLNDQAEFENGGLADGFPEDDEFTTPQR